MKSVEEKKMLDEDVSVPSISCFIQRGKIEHLAESSLQFGMAAVFSMGFSQATSFSVMKIMDIQSFSPEKECRFSRLENYIGKTVSYLCIYIYIFPYIITGTV